MWTWKFFLRLGSIGGLCGELLGTMMPVHASSSSLNAGNSPSGTRGNLTLPATRGGSRVWVPAGRFAPLFGLDKGQTSFEVHQFALDQYPVTQGEFHQFVQRNPEWRRESVSRLYADAKYLSDWRTRRPAQPPRAPMVYVSWFAASAFCEARGGRLPTTLEWEYVAAASEDRADASKDPAFVEKILRWYGQPTSKGTLVGLDPQNYYGIHNLHGLVWEWTSDFNGSFVTADNRADGDQNKAFFCGSGVTGAAKREDYAAFMRYAMRNSLGPDFSVMNVGFRCAYDEM